MCACVCTLVCIIPVTFRCVCVDHKCKKHAGIFQWEGRGVVQQFPIPEVDFPLSDPGISKVHNYYCVVLGVAY